MPLEIRPRFAARLDQGTALGRHEGGVFGQQADHLLAHKGLLRQVADEGAFADEISLVHVNHPTHPGVERVGDVVAFAAGGDESLLDAQHVAGFRAHGGDVISLSGFHQCFPYP